MTDPLGYLRRAARPTSVEVAGIGQIPAWGIIIGDRDDPDIHLFLNPESGMWMHEDLIYGDVHATSLGDVIDMLGPVHGGVALGQTDALRASWQARRDAGENLPVPVLEDEVERGRNLLGQAVRDAQAAHTRETTALTRALAELEVPMDDVAHAAPADPADLGYLIRVVEHADVHQWWVFADEEDEVADHLILHERPDRHGREGWWRHYPTDDGAQSVAVAQVCDEVGPLHAPAVIRETIDAREAMGPALGARIDDELAAARRASAAMIGRALRAHADQAQALERMSRRLPPPGEVGLGL